MITNARKLLARLLVRCENVKTGGDMNLTTELQELKVKLQALGAADLSASITTLDSVIVQLQTVHANLTALALADVAGMIAHVDAALMRLDEYEIAKTELLGVD